MVLGTAAAVGASAASATVFQYNRKNYLYDREMRLETEYRIMDFKIQRAKLFRDDVRDIIGLTSVKMDTYLIINAVQLGFCVMLFCEGRLSAGTPNWLIGAHTIALASAFTYLLMSVWLSMHAMVAARSYEVRLLTQLVRLPVPSWAQLEGARTYASTFEKVEARQMFRVPFAMGTQERVLGSSHGAENVPPDTANLEDDEGMPIRQVSNGSLLLGEAGANTIEEGVDTDRPFSADPWGLERPGDNSYELDRAVQTDPRQLEHIKLVRLAMQYWQSYDAFSRVSMSIGTNQLITALSYYVLGYVLVENHAVIAAWLGVVLFMAVACALIRLDVSLSESQYQLCVCLFLCGPVCMAIGIRAWAIEGTQFTVKVLVPIIYLSQAGWLAFILYISNVREQANGVQLPTGFRSVLYIDVFGWIKDNSIQRVFKNMAYEPGHGSASAPVLPPGLVGTRVNGIGPAMQTVRYQDGLPEPVRVDQLPGAARPTRAAAISKKHFAPSTFVPREKENPENLEMEELLEATKAGARPWLVFGGATSLFAVLWLTAGIFESMEVYGWKYLRVSPLLHDLAFGTNDHNAKQAAKRTSLLSFGQGHQIQTMWPHQNVHAVGLACDMASDTLVASSRFGLFTASLSDKKLKNSMHFKAAPFCEDIEGESLQDVALRCDAGTDCQAIVLNQHGRRLAKCNITTQMEHTEQGFSPGSLVSDEWLADADGAKTPAEKLESLAFDSSCGVDAHGCFYVGTSSNRIVELQEMADSTRNLRWFPHHLLQSRFNASSGGAMAVIHEKYLGVLQMDGRHVSVLDLHNGGAVVDSWVLPTPSNEHNWGAMCAAGDQLYFLSSGPSPQLWHFTLPERFHRQPEKVTAPAVGHKHRTSQVSLSVSADAQGGPIRRSLRR